MGGWPILSRRTHDTLFFRPLVQQSIRTPDSPGCYIERPSGFPKPAVSRTTVHTRRGTVDLRSSWSSEMVRIVPYNFGGYGIRSTNKIVVR